MKTLIAVPCMDTLPYQFVNSLLMLEGKTNLHLQANTLIYDSRNIISLKAIEEGFDRVMWIDSDMMFTPKSMKILSDDMDEYNADMFTGIYFKRRSTHAPVLLQELEPPTVDENDKPVGHVHEYLDYPQNSIFPVKGCGFGFCMTSVKLLKAVWDKFGPAFAPYAWGGEDISFCHRVNKLGYTIFCDSRVSCGHIGSFVYTEDFYQGIRTSGKR